MQRAFFPQSLKIEWVTQWWKLAWQIIPKRESTIFEYTVYSIKSTHQDNDDPSFEAKLRVVVDGCCRLRSSSSFKKV